MKEEIIVRIHRHFKAVDRVKYVSSDARKSRASFQKS